VPRRPKGFGAVTRQLRVAVVARSVAPLHGFGGLERSVLDLVRYLAAHEVRVTLITREPTTRSSPERRAPSPESPLPGPGAMETIFVPYRTFPFAGRRGTTILDRSTAYPIFGMNAGRTAWKLVRSGRADIVHGFGASVLGYARKRAESRAPLVLNPQGLEEFGATDPSRARVKRAAYLPLRQAVLACAAAADRVIATDRILEPAVRQHLDVASDRIRVIPNALDLSVIDTLAAPESAIQVRRRAGIRRDEHVLLSVGRVEANKGLHVLAAALGALREHGTALQHPWRWVIVGDGPHRPQVEQTAASLGLKPHVMFVGHANDHDLHSWYEAATLFVHPTLYEGSSLVTLEAMAHRRAVVASAAGGIPDKVRPGVNGWLVPPGDPAMLAGALSGALGDLERLAVMGLAGRAIVETEFSWETTGAATMQMYTDLLQGREAGGSP
ncbi:MAG: glycosyltransferase family 4 protein, partial [Vicinamibacterales bacterium]